MIEVDLLDRAPYPPHLENFIAGVTARARLGDGDALQTLERMAGDRDKRTRKKVFEARVKAGVGDRVEWLRGALKDSTHEVRGAALKALRWCGTEGCDDLVPPIAGCLNDGSEELHELAGEALRRIATTRDELLESVYPFLEWKRPALDYPADASPGQKAEIDRKNKAREQRDYGVRRSAIGALCYLHGSVRIQQKLLEIFDREELETKKDLAAAFCSCPSRPALVEELLARVQPDTAQGASALFALATLQAPAARDTFLRFLDHDNAAWAEASALGLTAVGLPSDLPRLEAFCHKWETGPTPPAEPDKAIIQGVHTMFYTSDAPALREFLRDVLLFPGRDVGDGWWLFDMPEADMGCHPTEGDPPANTRDVSFYCKNIHSSVEQLKARGVEFVSEVKDEGFGLVTRFRAPGGVEVQLYQPKY